MDQLTFTSTPALTIAPVKTHVLVGPDLTTIALETDQTVITNLNREQMLDLHAALARQLGFTD